MRHLWTFFIVTSVTVVIWVWAAGETRDDSTLQVSARFRIDDQNNIWEIKPDSRLLDVAFEGSARSLREARSVLRDLTLDLRPEINPRTSVDLFTELRRHPAFLRTGVQLLSVDPRLIEVDIDKVIGYTAQVRHVLPGVQTVGDVVLADETATVFIASAEGQTLPDPLIVDAFVDQVLLQNLDYSRVQIVEARLRLHNVNASLNPVISPAHTTVTFSVRSQDREARIENVRVHLAGPHEDHSEYVVELQPQTLRDITIEADTDLVRAINTNRASVIALVHLSNRDKEQGISSKQISCFMVLTADGNGVTVQGKTGDGSALPEIELTITRRE